MQTIKAVMISLCILSVSAGLAPAANLTINTARTFASLDGLAGDDDGVVDGCLTVNGNLTLTPAGSITANDPAAPVDNDASNICIDVAGNMIMQSNSAIVAENQFGEGSGGSITILVASNFTMGISNNSNRAARISSRKLTGTVFGDAGPITIDVGGNVELGIGSKILASMSSNASSGKGGDINIHADGNIALRGNTIYGAEIAANHEAGSCNGGKAGNITLTANLDVISEDGSRITVNGKCSAGEIVIAAGRRADIDGLVESFSSLTGTGAVQGPGGGPITIRAVCDLIVSDTGIISSRGLDPGADLVHLDGGCQVLIFGLVQSTGPGHAIPDDPPNHLNYTNRPDKEANSTAGVEVWSGGLILIDSTGEHHGEIDADTGHSPGGSEGTSWIDIFAYSNVVIIGDTVLPFAVHANGNGGTDDGGIVTVKSKSSRVTASGLALQADGTAYGGDILVEAAGNILLDTASLFARGDFDPSGGYGTGGHIGTVGPDVAGIRSYQGELLWRNGVGDVRPTGTDDDGDAQIAAADRGTIVYQDCVMGLVDVTGTVFPNNGLPETTPTEMVNDCNILMPSLQDYVRLQDCASCRRGGGGGDDCKWCTKSAVLSQVIQNMGECCAVPDIIVDLRGFDNCETVNPAKVGTDEPATCSIQAAVDYLMANGDPNNDGQLFIGVIAQDCDTGVVGSGPCLGIFGRGPYGDGVENVVIKNTRPQRLNVFGCSVDLCAKDPSLPVITIQDSLGKVTVMDIHVCGSDVAGYLIKNNSDLVIVKNARAIGNAIGYLIMDDNVEITGSPEIRDNGLGVVAMGKKISFRTNKVQSNDGVGMDVQGSNNSIRGGLIEENGSHGVVVTGHTNEIKDLDIYLNQGDGIRVAGHVNTITANDIGDKEKGNKGDGLNLTGNRNLVDGLGVFGCGGDGMEIAGNSNIVKRSDVGDKDKSNVGDGIRIAGSGNQILENDLYANGGDGLEVSGGTAASPNVLKKNKAGDSSSKNNGGFGIWIHDDIGNGTPDPVEVEENTTKANGVGGIRILGAGHELKKNTSDSNTGCEFNVSTNNFNSKDNKSNGSTVNPNTDGGAYPVGCLGTP